MTKPGWSTPKSSHHSDLVLIVIFMKQHITVTFIPFKDNLHYSQNDIWKMQISTLEKLFYLGINDYYHEKTNIQVLYLS